MAKPRLEVTVVGSANERWKRGWQFYGPAFVVPMGYAVPDDDQHIRLPALAMNEGVRDYHCTLLVAGNSVRIDMTPDALVYVNDRLIEDLNWVLSEGTTCTMRLGQRRATVGDANPTFRIKLNRDHEFRKPGRLIRHLVERRRREGGSIGRANQLWKNRHWVRAGLAALALFVSALGAYGYTSLEAQEQESRAFRDQVAPVLNAFDPKRERFEIVDLPNSDALRAAVRPIVAVPIPRGGAPDTKNLVSIGTTWLCCEGMPAEDLRWVTNQHVIDQMLQMEGGDLGRVVFVLAGPINQPAARLRVEPLRDDACGRPDALPSGGLACTHPNYSWMKTFQNERREFFQQQMGRADRADIHNPYDVAWFRTSGDLSALQPLALAPETETAGVREGDATLTIGYPWEAPNILRFDPNQPDGSPTSGNVMLMTGPFRISEANGANLVMMIDALPMGGSSGSPILNRSGQVIGIVGSAVSEDIVESVGAPGDIAAQTEVVTARVPVLGRAVFGYRADVVRQLIDPAQLDARAAERLASEQVFATTLRDGQIAAFKAAELFGCPEPSQRKDNRDKPFFATGALSQTRSVPSAGGEPRQIAWEGVTLPPSPHPVLVRVWPTSASPRPLSLALLGGREEAPAAIRDLQTVASMRLPPSDASRTFAVVSEIRQPYALEAVEIWCDGSTTRAGAP